MTRTATKANKRLAFNDRLNQALAFHAAGFRLKYTQLIVQSAAGDAAAIVKLAGKLLVDPRWLATGEPAPAAAGAIARVRLWRPFAELPEPQQRSLLACLDLVAQPDCGPGTCRYCGCTDEHGCGDCSWVDAASTICSACLQEQS